jgi:hypothetical protein
MILWRFSTLVHSIYENNKGHCSLSEARFIQLHNISETGGRFHPCGSVRRVDPDQWIRPSRMGAFSSVLQKRMQLPEIWVSQIHPRKCSVTNRISTITFPSTFHLLLIIIILAWLRLSQFRPHIPTHPFLGRPKKLYYLRWYFLIFFCVFSSDILSMCSFQFCLHFCLLF